MFYVPIHQDQAATQPLKSAHGVARGGPKAYRDWAGLLSEPCLGKVGAHWSFWANRLQLPPPGLWDTWVLLGGRGSGKTRAGAEAVHAAVASGAARRIALIGATHADARSVMVEGPSGLLAVGPDRPEFRPALNQVIWPNGAVAHLFGAVEPNRLRGPQFDFAWGDEFCHWHNGEATLANLRLGLRLGPAPRLVLTSTPVASGFLDAVLASSNVRLHTIPTSANLANLAPGFLATAQGRLTPAAIVQELEGRPAKAGAAALWTRSMLDTARVAALPSRLDRIVVAVDPPASFGAHSDACGIVAVGAVFNDCDPTAYVLADESLSGAPPRVWADAAMRLAARVGADCVVAEANMGGEMVRALLTEADRSAHVRLVHARLSKRARAIPIAERYARGQVRHVGRLPALEGEMLSFTETGAGPSPDRLDALVWALTDLFAAAGAPRLRFV
jgi:phage terminase large subunit-like protein